MPGFDACIVADPCIAMFGKLGAGESVIMCVGAAGGQQRVVGEVWVAPVSAKVKEKVECDSLPFFLTWRPAQAWWVAKTHPLLYLITLTFLLSIPLENSVTMVPPGGQPFDAGFVVTRSLYRFLKRRPAVNDLLAATNTVMVVLQTLYLVGVFIVHGRFQPALSATILYSSRGLIGWVTQLPVPLEFLGSAVDFPVANAPFFLFFSGHVGVTIIMSLEFRRQGSPGWASFMDALNVAQTVRLLAIRGHYTIDLVGGAVAGWISYYLALLYAESVVEGEGLKDSAPLLVAPEKVLVSPES